MERTSRDDVPPSADVLRACIRKGTITSAFNPVLCGSSYKNKGVQQVLDAVVDYMPAPTDVAAIKTVDADGNPIGERKMLGRRAVLRRWRSRSSTTPTAR